MPPNSGPITPPPSPPEPERPSPRVACPECGLSFIVGEISVATCPNCRNEVPTGRSDPTPSPEEASPEQ